MERKQFAELQEELVDAGCLIPKQKLQSNELLDRKRYRNSIVIRLVLTLKRTRLADVGRQRVEERVMRVVFFITIAINAGISLFLTV